MNRVQHFYSLLIAAYALFIRATGQFGNKPSLAPFFPHIYLQNDLYDNLKVHARTIGISISELIRRTLERDIQKDPTADATAFFERLKPLKSFNNIDAQDHVQAIRSKSRVLKKGDAQ
ncbi:ribbon-helix-helix domain-containing protein [Rhodoferax antarcticus]|uniref:ribbon-helix-helix domain-containing protein n=1 Tax=Rhodoferax antarcticus TaxID=81479 RepID=UPI00222551B4|nr:CopG family transcriptional regulator [Rhodoferax antarcticus]MCW2313841.1 hypothetical protein [Rhodoferax antarcticus]